MFRDTAKPISVDIHDMISVSSQSFGIPLPANFDHYICPITTLMVFDPVSNELCGHSYESTQIALWQEQEKKKNREEEKGEQKEDVVCTCPCCREPLTNLTPNVVLKNQIDTFLTTTKSQLEQHVQANPNAPNNASRKEIARLCNHFVRYGNHEALLREKFSEFCKNIIDGNFKEATETSKESSAIASRSSCRIL